MKRGMRLLFLLLFVQPSLFISPGNPPPQTNPPRTSVAQMNPGQPLPPGTVTYQNTWNTSSTQTCPPAARQSEPLTNSDGWSTTLKIPSMLFMGAPQGTYITQHFSVSKNGTFSVSDDSGNAFDLAIPDSGFSGIRSTRIVANTSTALETMLVRVGHVLLANITFAFSVYRRSCQPAGVRLDIHGTADWGPSRHGQIRLLFDRAPASARGDRAWFGNKSGTALGFDWSDSATFKPNFDAIRKTITYEVGPTFSIDPQTVGSTTNFVQSANGLVTRRIQFSTGRWWYFYFTGMDEYLASSADGISWSSGPLNSSCTNTGFDSAVSGTTLVYACSAYDRGLYWRCGTLNPDGSVTWGIPESRIYTGYPEDMDTSVALDTSGNVWLAVSETSAYTNHYALLQVLEYQGGTWGVRFSTYPSPGYWSTAEVVPLTNGRMGVVIGGIYDVIKTWSGSAWQPDVAPPFKLEAGGYSAVSVNDTISVVQPTGSGSTFFSYAYGSQSTASPVAVLSTSDGVVNSLSYGGHCHL